MTNWKDYIDSRFIPTSDFEFNKEEVSSSLRIKHIRTGTIVHFYWPSASWDKIGDIQFYNDVTVGWSGDTGPFEFSKEGVEAVNNLLEPVFNTGWRSRDIYLFGRHFKSIVHFERKPNGRALHYYSNDLGWVAMILFPILAILAGLKRLLGMTELKHIEPINKYTLDQWKSNSTT